VARACPDVAARPLHVPAAPESAYPLEARRRGLEGEVVALLDVDERGRVKKVRVVRRAGHGMDEVAERTMMTWRFAPAERHCVPAASRVRYTYQFTIR